MNFQIFIQKIRPNELIVLLILFSVGFNLIKSSCNRRSGAVCDSSKKTINFLEQDDIKFVFGASILLYTFSVVYDVLN
jgi:hypothetical protein